MNQILYSGYYEMHRLHDILLEARGHWLMELLTVSDHPHIKEDGRAEIWDRLRKMQPRRFPVVETPPEVSSRLAELFAAQNLEELEKINGRN